MSSSGLVLLPCSSVRAFQVMGSPVAVPDSRLVVPVPEDRSPSQWAVAVLLSAISHS